MNNKLRNFKSIWAIGMILLIVSVVFISTGAAPQPDPQPLIFNTVTSRTAIAKYLAAQQNSELSDEEKIKEAINAYFTLRYEGQKEIKEQDFSVLVEDDSMDWVKKEKDKREIELYNASKFNLGYESYKINIDFDSIEIKNNKATVQLREGHQVVFTAIFPEVSALANLQHTITLHNKKDGWVISKDEYQDELSELLSQISKEDIKRQIDNNYQLELELQKRIPTTSDKGFNSTSASISSLYTYSYDRNEAVRYADAHIPTESCPVCAYNNAYYITEYTYGDCTNFVSQALYAGGGTTPPDTKGMTTAYNRVYGTDWFYVFNNPAGTQNGSGSEPWIGVEAQYTFITTNTNKIGPYGYVTYDLCAVNKGDIVQIQKYGSPPFDHEGLIVGKGAGCGTLSNTLVDAHMIDRYHYPLSYWPTNRRFIVISGYRSNLVSSFADVQPTHWAWQEIERLYANHITGGCGTNPLTYCPENTVTRAQMAVFLLKGIHGYTYSPPQVGGSTGFADVPTDHWAAAWIKQLAAEGITGGCLTNPLRYCPDNSVTHAQMAVFLLKSIHGASFTAPNVPSAFSDTVGHWAEDWIAQIASEGVTYGAHGCGVEKYCPESAVTRAEMAGMLLRAFNLP